MTRGFKKLDGNATIPERATKHSAGYDISASETVTNNQAKARSIYNSLIKDNIFYIGISKNLAIALIELGIDSSTTDNLSVEKIQEIRVEDLKDFNSKILQAELKNQKLQKEIDAAKKYIEESYKADKEDNKLLDLIIETVEKLQEQLNTTKKYIEHVIGTIKHDGHLGTIQTDWILPDLEKALAAIGGDDD